MESISDEILKTIKFAIEKLEVRCDKTFVSVIKQVNTNGTYVIQHQSGTNRTVKCSIPNVTLINGQAVYVKIPSGDLKRMHVCGIV
jgi:ferredoxin-fold anticodon binding domain-containing protein